MKQSIAAVRTINIDIIPARQLAPHAIRPSLEYGMCTCGLFSLYIASLCSLVIPDYTLDHRLSILNTERWTLAYLVNKKKTFPGHISEIASKKSEKSLSDTLKEASIEDIRGSENESAEDPREAGIVIENLLSTCGRKWYPRKVSRAFLGVDRKSKSDPYRTLLKIASSFKADFLILYIPSNLQIKQLKPKEEILRKCYVRFKIKHLSLKTRFPEKEHWWSTQRNHPSIVTTRIPY